MPTDSEHHAAGRLTVSTMQQADSEHHAAGKQTAELMTKQRNNSHLQIKSDILFYFSTLQLSTFQPNIILLFCTLT